MKDTIRRERSLTRLPAGVCQMSSLVSTPSRNERVRSYCSSSATLSSSGSSSTYRRIVFASGALTIVWPTVAKPYASSAWWIGQISWKPLMNVPCA